MTNKKNKKCTNKDCHNPAFDGNYCLNCKRKRDEKRDMILKGVSAAAVSAAFLVGGIAKNKDVIKNVPEVAAKVTQAIRNIK